MTGSCATCGKELARRNRSGYCKRHVSAFNALNPEMRARQTEGIRRKIATDPVFAAALRKRARTASACNNPEDLRRRFIEGRIWEIGTASCPAGSEPRRRAAARISETRLKWCPPHLRDEYRFLTKTKGLRAAEARAMIEQQHEMELARWRKKHAPELATSKMPELIEVHVDPWERAQHVAAQLFGMTTDEMFAGSRDKRAVMARQSLILALKRQGMTWNGIATRMNCDRTTARHAVETGPARCEREPGFAQKVNAIEMALAMKVAA